MMEFKSGELLIYCDRIHKRTWSVISLYRHATWCENVVCYCFCTPTGHEEDLNTIMNIPAFFLWRHGEMDDHDSDRVWWQKPLRAGD